MHSWLACSPVIRSAVECSPGAGLLGAVRFCATGKQLNSFQGLPMDPKLLDILACPLCKGPLKLADDKSELICKADALAFPVRDGIPVMLENEARSLNVDERLDK